MYNSLVTIYLTAYRIGSRQVDAQAAGAGAEQKNENVVARLKILDHVAAVGNFRRSVQPNVRIVLMHHKLLKNIHHLGHETVDEHAMALVLQSVQQAVQHAQFARVHNEMLLIYSKKIK